MQADLVNTRTAEVIHLGDPAGSSWGPVWSPDGRRVAFYSDEGGEAGLWVWNRSSGRSVRFPGVIVRPDFGYELVKWMSDGERIACQVLPAGMSVADANSTIPDPHGEGALQFRPASGKEPSVLVFAAPESGRSTAREADGGLSFLDRAFESDLAIVNVRTSAIQRIAQHTHARWFGFSPDNRYLAYVHFLRSGLSPEYRLTLYDLSTGLERTLTDHFQLHAGNEVNWSPDGRYLAYLPMTQIDTADISSHAYGTVNVVGLDGVAKEFPPPSGSHFDAGYYRGPLWISYGSSFLETSQGKLWRFDVTTGKSSVAAQIPGHEILRLATLRNRSQALVTGNGNTVWALTQDSTTRKFELYRIGLDSGESKLAFETSQSLPGRFGRFHLDASEETGDIYFAASDQQRAEDIWARSMCEPVDRGA